MCRINVKRQDENISVQVLVCKKVKRANFMLIKIRFLRPCLPLPNFLSSNFLLVHPPPPPNIPFISFSQKTHPLITFSLIRHALSFLILSLVILSTLCCLIHSFLFLSFQIRSFLIRNFSSSFSSSYHSTSSHSSFFFQLILARMP